MKQPTRRRWSLRLGSVAGIDIRVHASMLLLLWLILATAEQTADGTVGSLLWVTTIFLCVLTHEFSHSLTARHFGVTVREIELLPIGGVSKLEHIPDDPRQELTIALAGPAASVVIGLVALAVTSLVHGEVPAPALAGGAFWARFAWFNLMIGGFNLVPALPLDGGRVLRAIFEMREGPLRATRHAARLARVLAGAMVAVGVLTGQFFLMLIGVFIAVVSRTEEASAEVHDRLQHVLVGELMVRSPIVLHEHTVVSDITPVLRETAQRHFPVVDNAGRVVGVFNALGAGSRGDETRVRELTVATPTISATTDVDASGILECGGVLPVVDATGGVIGLLNIDDVMHAVQVVFTREAQGLRR